MPALLTSERDPGGLEVTPPSFLHRALKGIRHVKHKPLIVGVAVASILVISFIASCYVEYAAVIAPKLRAGPFASTLDIFAAPPVVAVGDRASAAEITAALRRAGYGTSTEASTGWYRNTPNTVEIFPGTNSYVARDPVEIKFAAGKIASINSVKDHTVRKQYELDPQLITNLAGRDRDKRRLVRFSELPKDLVQAVLAAEDKRFFQHQGLDPLRLMKAVYVDVKEGRKRQGASTITMQLARSLWLESGKNWRRKWAEAWIALCLEHRLSKEEIFEYYANEVYLGRRGTFSVRGFGAAARIYFGKDLNDISLAEAATLAGMVQRPGYYDPWQNPSRVRERRNRVLTSMRENGQVSNEQFVDASQAALGVMRGDVESTGAPYFVDLVRQELQDRLKDQESARRGVYSVYTTLDLDLQRAAEEAVQIGMRTVDQQVARKNRGRADDGVRPQVALVALDPHTGQVKALVGGRDYTGSQLNRAFAKRQPGSVFKPFVYAAALNTAVLHSQAAVLTPASLVMDEPAEFEVANEAAYEPRNFGNAFYGEVTLRRALAKSLNVAAVKVAEAVGYQAVVNLARQAGLKDAQATPALALGAYDATPLDIAGAYTVYANRGAYVTPNLISTLRADNGSILYSHTPVTRNVLDPRVAYLMVNLLQDVMTTGTAAGVRGRGFTAPAAGKTGTSRDGWFAGFTSDLLCVVWVGFDDNRDLRLEGAKSALPIWTEFMKRALGHHGYRNPKPFSMPAGIESVQIDPITGQLATDKCPETRAEVFVAGTQPAQSCTLHRTTGVT